MQQIDLFIEDHTGYKMMMPASKIAVYYLFFWLPHYQITRKNMLKIRMTFVCGLPVTDLVPELLTV